MKIKKVLQYQLEPLRSKSAIELARLIKWSSLYDYGVFLLSFPLVVNFFSGADSESLSTGFIMKNTFVYFCIATGLRWWLKSDHRLLQTFSFDQIRGMCLFILLSFAIFYPFMLLMSQKEALPLFVPVIHGLTAIILLIFTRLIDQIKQWQSSRNSESQATASLIMLDSKLSQEVFSNWHVYGFDSYIPVITGKQASTELSINLEAPLITLDTLDDFITELQLQERVPERVIIDPRAYDSQFIRRLFRRLTDIGISVLKLAEDPIQGIISVKPLSAYDLLSNFDNFAYSAAYTGKTIAIYVSGNTLSGDIARFLAKSAAREIILLGSDQHCLEIAESKISDTDWNGKATSYLINGYNLEAMNNIFKTHTPEYFFHAAGIEGMRFSKQNPLYTFKQNFWQNHMLCQAAITNKVSNFFYLDTGTGKASKKKYKLGNRTNVATIQTSITSHILSQNEAQIKTKFYVIDMYGYGNSGEHVLSKILDEVEHGGPVHIPHKEHMQVLSNIDHIFCELSNVSNLPAVKDRVYVLEGGKPVRLYDMVEDAIMLKGLKPELDIEIVFTGSTEQSPLLTAMNSVNGQSNIPGVDNIFYRRHKTPDYGLVQKVMTNFERYLNAKDLPALEKAVLDLSSKETNYKQETAA